ncbi:hypothetical protein MOB18_21375 [Bacillus inaquosorum]|uniref:hypothetical protein n=1 Tax=Bacillus inaquosorum TaxID=483913 RepID=UPI00228012A2|nr:hypothetical protein [Bacillus inaquosorum]MCY7751615.1 hypothetical protein [Bacillus inaquosorum]
MTETNASIHVLADETLGGIKREYVEVNRKAEVGEKVVCKRGTDDVTDGKVYEIVQVIPPFANGEGFGRRFVDDCGRFRVFWRDSDYRTLEPTDIVHIDGPDGTQRYELTDRKAEEGEEVIHVNKDCGKSDGEVTEVTDVGASTVDVVEYEVSDGEYVCGISHGHYRVLVPVESAKADEPQPADLIDVVSNLATRVAELERENKKLHAALDEDMKIRSENTRRYLALKDEIDTLHKDNRTLGEELARLKEPKDNEIDYEEAALVFIQRKVAGPVEVYQDGKRLRGVISVNINAKVGELTTHTIEFGTGRTAGDRP